ncbi:MAG: ribosome assembly factor SBDS [Nanoarchaeota archaeon]
MAKVVARIKVNGKHFEIHVDLDAALKVREGKGDIMSAVDVPKVFTDVNKGMVASNAELENSFNTTDFYEIAKRIITKGEVQKTQEFRDSEREAKIKQVITILIKNCSDQHGRPYTEERIQRALKEAHINIDNKPAEQQISGIVQSLQKVIPIKIDLKRIKITIPAQYTAQTYSLLKDYKESEDWLANGALECILNIPAGMQIDFYDKLNKITHGAVQSQDLAEKS